VQDIEHLSDGLYDTTAWEIDQSGYVAELSSKEKKKEKKREKEMKKAAEKKKAEEEKEKDRAKTLSADGIEMTMEDAAHTVDPRAESDLGIYGDALPSKPIVYDNPMGTKKKKDSSVGLKKSDSSVASPVSPSYEKISTSPEEPPAANHEAIPESEWLFN
jgi:hypothetical protein